LCPESRAGSEPILSIGVFDPLGMGNALPMTHTATVRTPADHAGEAANSPAAGTSDSGVAEALGGVALAAVGSGGRGIRQVARQARRHPKAFGIVLLMVVSAVLGWRWARRRSAPADSRVTLLDAA
jgi:hypothetical protein